MPNNYTLCKEGDVAFADASEDTNDVGKVVEFLDCNEKKIVCGLHTIHGRDKQDLTVKGFKGYAFSSASFRSQIRKLAQGTKIYSISSKNFQESHVCIPNKDEQNKIARFLTLLDERISTQNKIIEQYKSLIKGLGAKLLSLGDSSQIALKNILIERNERSRVNNQHEILSSTTQGLFLQSEYFNREIASKDNVGYKIVRKYDIIISPQNLWMGNINFNDRFDFGLVSPSYKVYSISAEYNKYFISYLLRSHRALYGYVTSSEQGASIVRRNLNIDVFNELAFAIPNINLQNTIGSILQTLNKRCSLEKAYLDRLGWQKQFLLQQMFI